MTTRWAELAWSALLLVVGSLSLASAWHQWAPLVALPLAAVLPLLVLRLSIAMGVGRWAATSVLVLLLVLAAYVLAADADTALLTTVRDAVPRLLTTPQPYPDHADLLVGPLLLTSLTSLLVGLRHGSGRRFTPVAAAAGLYTSGLLLTAGLGDPHGMLAALLVVTAVGGWVLLDDPGGAWRGRAAGIGPVLALAVLGVAVASTVPAPAAFEPRTLVDPPVLEVVASSPMPFLGAWAADPEVELLRVTGPEVPLRLVTLDRYDGSSWSTATRFVAFGTERLEPALPPGGEQRSLTHRVEVVGLGGQWLPSGGQARAVSDDAVRVDPRTGTLFRTGAADGADYRVTAVLDTPADEALPAARVPAGGALADPVAEHLAVPELPRGLREASDQAVAGAVTPYERAQAVETFVRGAAELSTKAISGSQLWRIDAFLQGNRGTPGAGVGTSEQFATAFALLARANGLPTRVVVGFRPGEASAEGERVVRGRDAFAWPEVYFQDLGWVPFAPTPDDDTFRRDPAQESMSPGDDEPLPTPTPAPGAERDEEAEPAARQVTGDESPLPWPLVAAGLLALLLPTLALVRLVRSRRHLARGATGAWSEVLDVLHLAGLRPARHQSATEVAGLADARWDIAATAELARLAEQAAYAPGASRGGAHDPAALRDLLRTLRRAARTAVPWWRRWWWPLDPRVLLRR